AGGLLISVWVVKSQAQKTFTQINGGFDAVLGARSSQLQLVLNCIFHMEASPGNIEWKDFLDIKNDPNVALAIPISVGDNYRGYRLVGTTPEMFSQNEYAPGKKFQIEGEGNFFHAGYQEAVVGSFVAHKLKLKTGEEFHPFHGLTFNEKEQHAESYTIVGILKPSNTPADRVIWIPLEGLQNMSGHTEKASTEVSAVLLKFKSPIAGKLLQMKYNQQGNRLTLAWPIGTIMAQLLDKVSWFDRVLALVAYLVAIVAAASILASIYNSMNERRREIAILRALGAQRRLIFFSVVLEAMAISALGMCIAFLIYGVLMSVVAQIIRAQTGVVLDAFSFHPVMILAPLGIMALSALAGIVPAFKAYRTEVAANLVPNS
ncbi:MAG: FtsX-like permease family protein, partial [Verrucomicrobiota bacterium]